MTYFDDYAVSTHEPRVDLMGERRVQCLTCSATLQIDGDLVDAAIRRHESTAELVNYYGGKPAVEEVIRQATEAHWRVRLSDPLGRGTCPDCLTPRGSSDDLLSLGHPETIRAWRPKEEK